MHAQNIKFSGSLSRRSKTAATLSTFILMMMLNPEVQRKAQQELDHTVGKTRLPSPKDRGHLPYLEAILKEVYRFVDFSCDIERVH